MILKTPRELENCSNDPGKISISQQNTCPFNWAMTALVSYSQPMSTDYILAQIDAEISRLTQVRALLAKIGKPATKVTGSKAKKAPAKARKRRILSPEARKRIADAQRKRWAAQKAKAK